MCLRDGLSKREQIVVRIEQRKFFLTPGLDGQMSCWMNRDVLSHHPLVEAIDVVRTDIHLAIILGGVQRFKEKKMNLHTVLDDHQVLFKFSIAELPLVIALLRIGNFRLMSASLLISLALWLKMRVQPETHNLSRD